MSRQRKREAQLRLTGIIDIALDGRPSVASGWLAARLRGVVNLLDAPPRKRRERTPPVNPHEARFRELWASGVLIKVIAHELGISKHTVLVWRRKLDLPPRRVHTGRKN